MRITFSFSSLKDLSDISNGERFIEILLSNGLIIEKAGDCEPIKKCFTINDLPQVWKGVGIGDFKTCYFLFKGKREIKFTGMVIWKNNLYPGSKSINGINLWLAIPKSCDFKKLIQLGDDIFKWSDAVYGYITEDSKDPYNNQTNELPGNIQVIYMMGYQA